MREIMARGRSAVYSTGRLQTDAMPPECSLPDAMANPRVQIALAIGVQLKLEEAQEATASVNSKRY